MSRNNRKRLHLQQQFLLLKLLLRQLPFTAGITKGPGNDLSFGVAARTRAVLPAVVFGGLAPGGVTLASALDKFSQVLAGLRDVFP